MFGILNPRECVSMMEKHQLTLNMLFILSCITSNDWDSINRYRNYLEIPNLMGLDVNAISHLELNGWLERNVKTNKYTITDKTRKLFVEPEIGFVTLFKEYPKYFEQRDNSFQYIALPLCNRDSKNDLGQRVTMKDAMKRYHEIVNGSYNEHLELVADVKYGAANKLIRGTIYDWFFGQNNYIVLREMRYNIVDNPGTISVYEGGVL